MCGSRKYPYPHHGGKFTKDPPASPEFLFFQENGNPPPLRIFHKYDKNPPIPSGKFTFLGTKCLKIANTNIVAVFNYAVLIFIAN